MPSDNSAAADQDKQNRSSQPGNRLFRQEAFARRGQREPIDGLLRVTAPHEWIILIGLLVATLALLAWGILGTAERGMSTDCLMVFTGERYPVLASISGTVAEVLVTAGDEVETGQPLARLVDNQLVHQIRLARAKLALLEENAETDNAQQIASVRQDLLELSALQSASESVVSPVSGEVMRHNLIAGKTIQVDAEVAIIRGASNDDIDAVAFVSSDYARLLNNGMQARINAPFATDDGQVLKAEIANISGTSINSPPWLSSLGLVNENRGHLVSMALLDQPASNIADGTECDAHIVYEHGSPLSLILP